jgi:immune inhibitor A
LKRTLWAIILLACLACAALVICAASTWFVLGTARPTTSARAPSPEPAPTVTVQLLPSAATTPESLLANVLVPFADPYDLAKRLKHIRGVFPQPTALAPPSYSVGDRDSFWVLNLGSAQSFQISATLRYIGPHLYMWVQDGLSVAQESLEQSEQTFEERLYPTVRRYFGSEWSPGIDNDVRLTVLNARFSGASGYFSSSDQYPASVVPTSNGREMFYINVDSLQPGTSSYDATLAHELQHMVHWFADPNEDSWVNEGLSELAEHLCGYSKDGRIRVFAANPDIQLTNWENSGQVTSHYAASFLFMAYFAERFGPDWTRDLVANEQNGTAGFDAVLREHGTTLLFTDVFADWVVANYLDGESGSRDVAPYLYQGLDVQVQPEQVVSTYPTQGDGSVNQYGADYIELGPSAQDLQLEFHGETTTRLVPNTAHSGRYQWWSNCGDNSDMTLTRAFDLRGVGRPTLQAWLWYDIEDGWDYAYVEVSADGGETWQILPGQYTTTRNPSGQSYGPGYTGQSGESGFSTSGAAQWIEEAVDLSSFAGQRVLIRFEYITDDAVNHSGLCIDDIRIPQLRYSYDAEEGDGGWVAQGFVRTDNTLPQHYLVQVIRLDENATVQRLWVEGENGVTLTMPRVEAEAGRSMLVISAVTRFSHEPARYQYEIQPITQTESPTGIRQAQNLLP